MMEAGYPDLAAHKEIHQTMIAKVEEFQEEYQRTGHEAPGRCSNVSQRVADQSHQWNNKEVRTLRQPPADFP